MQNIVSNDQRKENSSLWRVFPSFCQRVTLICIEEFFADPKANSSIFADLTFAYYSVIDSFSYLYCKLANSIRISAL